MSALPTPLPAAAPGSLERAASTLTLPRDWHLLSTPERWHLVTRFSRELCCVESATERRRMLGQVAVVAPELAARLAASLGLKADAELIPADVVTPGRARRGTRTRELSPYAT